MRCDLHCPPEAGSGLRGPLLALAGLAVLSLAVYVLAAVAPLLAWLAAGCVVLAAGAVYAARRSSRWAVVHWPAMQQAAAAPRVDEIPASPVIAVQAALPAPPLALPAARPAVQGVVVSDGERIGA